MRPSGVQIFTRTTPSPPRMRRRTARSRPARAALSPRNTAGVTCGATLPWPARRVSSRASRSASSLAARRRTTPPPIPRSITATSAVTANLVTAPATEPSSGPRNRRRRRRRAHGRAEEGANVFIDGGVRAGRHARETDRPCGGGWTGMLSRASTVSAHAAVLPRPSVHRQTNGRSYENAGMGFDQYHEPAQELPAETRTFARLCASLTEEAEAIGWYEQRIALEPDRAAREIMLHAQGAEVKH